MGEFCQTLKEEVGGSEEPLRRILTSFYEATVTLPNPQALRKLQVYSSGGRYKILQKVLANAVMSL